MDDLLEEWQDALNDIQWVHEFLSKKDLDADDLDKAINIIKNANLIIDICKKELGF